MREDRRVDFVELVESVTYAVCGDDNVDFEKFRIIFEDKNYMTQITKEAGIVLTKFFRLIDRDGDGVVTAEQIMEFISQLSSTRSSSRLTKENILFLEKLFRENVGNGSEIRKEDFKRIIQTKNEFFLDRVFDIFDEDGSGSISLHEFLDAMHQFAGQDADDKIRFLFKVYDVDGDGVIRCEELGKVMRACLAENGMKFSDTQTDELTRALFEDADVEGKGALTFDALKAQLKKHPGLLENMSIMLDQWLVPPEKPKQSTSIVPLIKDMKPHQLSIKYIKNNYVYLIWRLLFIIVNIALFSSRCVDFHEKHPNATTYLVLARGAATIVNWFIFTGQCLNFNCTFIVIVMLRQCLTFLRARGASAFLPIDQHIKFHKMTGQLIFFFSVLHTIMHLINISIGFMPSTGPLPDGCLTNKSHGLTDCPLNSGNWSYMEFLFDPKTTSQPIILELGLIPGYAFNSGVIIMIILTVMVVGSMPFVRRGGCFEVFYWTHLLYFVFWMLLIVHAPNFWKWFLVPGVIFLIEQFIIRITIKLSQTYASKKSFIISNALRYYNWKMGRGRTSASSGILLPSKVTHVVIRRPPNFDFRPGDYVFVRIPKIAKSEWHPFTISSAPEQEDSISLHIRACGQWTSRLYEYFEKEQQKLTGKTGYNDNVARTKRFSRKVKSPEGPIINQHPALINESETLAESRKRLPTVGVRDSQDTIDPTSSNSEDGPNNEVFSSVETVNECDAMIRVKNVPIQLKPKPKLTSTKSLPNVHERMKKREVKMQVRSSAPHFQRSMSVNEMENNENGTVKSSRMSSIGSVRARRTTAASFKYMRNKPTVIALKTPSYEEANALEAKANMNIAAGIGCDQKIAEEGRLGSGGGGGNNGEMDPQLESEANELHPILGTTNTKHGALAVGRPLEIYLDGPYGAPSSHIFRAEHAVLIATGIGVTPFASILQSIMHRYWASRICCPNCSFAWCGELPQSVLNLKKVDFFWINRDQRSFEWFVHLLSQLEIEQAESGAMERFLDMHMYITSALQRTDMKAVGLQLALDLLHEKEKRDLITGLKTRTNAGRPNWNKVRMEYCFLTLLNFYKCKCPVIFVFQQIAEQRKGKVTVFYCGPPALARSLKFKCDEFGFTFRKEIF
ncbi:NADPH oxidase 5 [Orchesella cincta]|uniref:NADPH oxidase 5 n=1 Tax=Orchesella cincta TaxID=48709 RepID=A0A1D2MKU9_ORCCI|nr:NADPH oxidase 5 [Orchesella cincta]